MYRARAVSTAGMNSGMVTLATGSTTVRIAARPVAAQAATEALRILRSNSTSFSLHLVRIADPTGAAAVCLALMA